MFECTLITTFVAGTLFGLCIAAIIAGYVWIHLTRGSKRKKELEYFTDERGVVRAHKE